MKSLLRSTLLTAFAFYVASLVAPGLIISGSILHFLGIAFAFVIATAVLKPLFSIVAFPFAFLSTFIVLLLSNAVGLYIVALILKSVNVLPFTISAIRFYNLHIGQIQVGSLLSYIVISAIIAMVVKILEWVFDF